MTELIQGTFISEGKRRFLCTVRVQEQDILCYVPSSCHLSPFIDLEGRTVLLTRVESPRARTSYSLFAVKYKQSFILLNLAYANTIIEKELGRRIFSFLGRRKTVNREQVVGGYKTDLYIHDTDTLIEIKTVLSTNTEVNFPSMVSKRANRQLRDLLPLLNDGHKVVYFVVSLNPYVKEIRIDPQYDEFYTSFIECLNKGMKCYAFSVQLKDGVPMIYRRLPLRITDS